MKREKYEKFLKSVPLLREVSDYERSQLADGLNSEEFKMGDFIIKQGSSMIAMSRGTLLNTWVYPTLSTDYEIEFTLAVIGRLLHVPVLRLRLSVSPLHRAGGGCSLRPAPPRR